MREPVDYALVIPISVEHKVQGAAPRTESVTSLSVRALTAGDMRWLDQTKGKPGQSLDLIGRLTGLTAAGVDKLDPEDVAGISQVIESFLPDSLRTGTTSPET